MDQAYLGDAARGQALLLLVAAIAEAVQDPESDGEQQAEDQQAGHG
jgi:hypothetical protein